MIVEVVLLIRNPFFSKKGLGLGNRKRVSSACERQAHPVSSRIACFKYFEAQREAVSSALHLVYTIIFAVT